MNTQRRPYWLDEGTESCDACTHRYIREMEYRCVACDCSVCAVCVVIDRTTREAWCPRCAAAAAVTAAAAEE